VPTVSAAAPGGGASAQVVYENQNWSTRVNGTEPQYFAIRDWQIARGSSFTDDDVSHSANVAVLGATGPPGVHLNENISLEKLVAKLALRIKLLG
jgi:hypothetical protein